MRLLPSSGQRPGRVLAGLAVMVGLVAALAAVLWIQPGSGQTVTEVPVESRDSTAGDPPTATFSGPTGAGARRSGTSTASPDVGSSNGAGSQSGTGSLEPVPYQEVTPEPAIPLSATGDFGTGLTLEVTDVEPVRSVARRPGEISAPALRVHLEAHNGSSKAIPLDGMVITLDYGSHRTPAVDVAEPGGDPFRGTLTAGRSQRGVYVFNVPEVERGRIRLTMSYTGAAPTLVLTGSAA